MLRFPRLIPPIIGISLFFIALFGGCPAGDGPGAACNRSADCTRNPLSECVEGVCEAVQDSALTSCDRQGDCLDDEICASGVCALAPSCLRIAGSFHLLVESPQGDAVTGEDVFVSADDGCNHVFSLDEEDTINFRFDNTTEPVAAQSVGNCEEGWFSAAESAPSFSGCTIGGLAAYNFVLTAAEPAFTAGLPCRTDISCQATQNCQPLPLLTGVTPGEVVGFCQ